jgi:prepilin signal peptidase PulO-like enzyme (type II secretory pathway)
MSGIVMIFLAILGASLGSFLSVVIYRLKHNIKGTLVGRSRCPNCKKNLKSYDLIPVLNYIILGGRCRYCKKPISLYYFFLEITTGLVFLLMYLRFPFVADGAILGLYTIDPMTALQYVFATINGTLLIGIFFFDLQYMEVPDMLIYPLIVIATIGTLITGSVSFPDLLIAIAAALVFFGGQRLVSKGKWLGEGDVYVALAMAVMFGWKLFIVAVSFSYVIGAALCLFLLAIKSLKAKSKIPFAPFLVFGTFVTILYGNEILAWYMNLLNI